MAFESQQLIDRFNRVSTLPAVRQTQLLLGLAASIALGIGLVQWAMAPDYTPLFGDLPAESSAEIIRQLDEQGVPYQVEGRGGLVTVPHDRVRELRIKLASEGLPKQSALGYDSLNHEQSLGLSSFMEKARFDRALEQELSRSIASLENVNGARVHLALPKQSAFVRRKDKPAASVLVNLAAGRQLTDRQLAGIVHLVAFSVPGLEAEQVSVVGNDGRLLSSQAKDSGFGLTTENFRYTELLEERYADRIIEILTPILGVGAVQTQVAAELDFTVVETTSEKYEPETSVRSEQLSEEITSDPGALGVPGTLSNQPPVEVPPAENAEGEQVAAAPSRSNKQEIRNYEVDRTISHIRETPGGVKRLTVAVVVDYTRTVNEQGDVERTPLSPERLAEITTLVKEAIGFDEDRGDRVNVVNASFVPPPEFEPLPAASILEAEWLWRSGKLLLAAVAVFATLFVVVRPLMQASTPGAAPAAALPAGAAAGDGGPLPASAEAMMMGDDRVTLGLQGLPAGEPAYKQQLDMARNMVQGEPERAAHVLKGWVAADD